MNEAKLRALEERALARLRSPEFRAKLDELKKLSEQLREAEYLRWLEDEQEKDRGKEEK